MRNLNDKLTKLKKILKDMDGVLIAYSGGVDSTFLLGVAKKTLGKNVLAVTASSETYPKSELKEAKNLAKEIGVKHIIIDTKETEIKGFRENPKNRCYYCKKELFSKLINIANKSRISYVLDGSNYDDLSDFRPGMKAVKELNIRSPLKEAKLTKKNIRALSKRYNLKTWKKPAFACLSSRFPYGEEITKKKISRVDKSEIFIRNLGVNQLRVRHHNNIARIEVDKKDFSKLIKNSELIVKKLKNLGFNYVTIDLQGYRTGSMNEVLK